MKSWPCHFLTSSCQYNCRISLERAVLVSPLPLQCILTAFPLTTSQSSYHVPPITLQSAHPCGEPDPFADSAASLLFFALCCGVGGSR